MFDMENGVTLTYALDRYDDMLNECYPELFGLQPSRILREVDPIQYRCGFYDWLDGEDIDSDTLTGEDSRLP
jgi:hypothetical protein